MTKKEAFIKIINYLFEEESLHLNEGFPDEWPIALEFWQDFKAGKVKNSSAITENGKGIISWMQNNYEHMDNLFTAHEIAEALFTSGRSIAGSMRKLVTDEFVEKIGKDPVKYSLTDKGKNITFDN